MTSLLGGYGWRRAAACPRPRAVILRPVSFDDDADDDANDAASLFGPPPHQDDRLWRHPSEMRDCPGRRQTPPFGAAGAPAGAAGRPAAGVPWGMVAGAVGAMGALLAGLVVGVAGVGDDATPRNAARPSSTPTFGERPTDDATLALARDAVAPSVVSVGATPVVAARPTVTAPSGGMSRPSAAEVGAPPAQGSGVILRREGIVVTSADVVGTAAVTAQLQDGRQVAGHVVGTDPVTGLAVVDLDGGGYPVADPAPAALGRGTRVVTVWAGPDGPAASGGVVGASERVTGEGPVPMEGMLVVDGPAGADDLGAATVDRSGALVGVTTVVEDDMSYTVPLDVVGKVTDDILTVGEARHSMLGIDGLDTGDPGDRLGLLARARRGVFVSSVVPGGPSATAGLQRADVILAIDGRPVATMPDLVRWLRARSPGEQAILTIERDGVTSDVTVSLGALGPG